MKNTKIALLSAATLTAAIGLGSVAVMGLGSAATMSFRPAAPGERDPRQGSQLVRIATARPAQADRISPDRTPTSRCRNGSSPAAFMASSRVADVVVLSRPARMANRLNQAAQRRLFDAVACHHKRHHRVVKELGQVQPGTVHMHGDPPRARPPMQLSLAYHAA